MMRRAIPLSLLLLGACAGMSAEEEALQKEWARQLGPEFEKLPAAWKKLQEEGLTTKTRLELEFSYKVPSESVAQDFSRGLREKFGYHVETSAIPESEEWSVKGRTVETTVTLEILKKWISYMVQAGVESGGRFEGWGATGFESGGI